MNAFLTTDLLEPAEGGVENGQERERVMGQGRVNKSPSQSSCPHPSPTEVKAYVYLCGKFESDGKENGVVKEGV